MKKAQQIELFNKAAPYYNFGVKYLTFGVYSRFMRKAIDSMNIHQGEKILDICTGTGINLKEIAKRVGDNGEVVGIDLSEGMLSVAKKNLGDLSNVRLIHSDVTSIEGFENYFDKALLSFCIHEVDTECRFKMLERVRTMLKDGGSIYLADYNNIPFEQQSFFRKFIFRILEHEEGLSYLRMNIKDVLVQKGFQNITQHPFANNLLLLTQAKKVKS